MDMGNTEKSIFLDYRDDNLVFYPPLETTGHPIDVWVKFNHDDNRFYINSYGGLPSNPNWNSVSDGSSVDIWELKGQGSFLTIKFEPHVLENLSISLDNGKPKLIWQHHSPSDDYWVGYKIFRCITVNNESPTNFIEIETVGKTTTNYTDNDLCFANWKNIHYKVKSKNTDRDSEFSNEIQINLNEEIVNCDLTFNSDITVPSGKTLTIEAGSELTFQNNSKLYVYGTLKINGTSSDKVTFDFVSPSSYNGIKFYSNASGTVNNNLNN